MAGEKYCHDPIIPKKMKKRRMNLKKLQFTHQKAQGSIGQKAIDIISR